MGSSEKIRHFKNWYVENLMNNKKKRDDIIDDHRDTELKYFVEKLLHKKNKDRIFSNRNLYNNGR